VRSEPLTQSLSTETRIPTSLTGNGTGAAAYGIQHREWSSSPRHRLLLGYETPCGELPNSIWSRNFDTSSRRGVTPDLGVARTNQDRAAGV